MNKLKIIFSLTVSQRITTRSDPDKQWRTLPSGLIWPYIETHVWIQSLKMCIWIKSSLNAPPYSTALFKPSFSTALTTVHFSFQHGHKHRDGFRALHWLTVNWGGITTVSESHILGPRSSGTARRQSSDSWVALPLWFHLERRYLS